MTLKALLAAICVSLIVALPAHAQQTRADSLRADSLRRAIADSVRRADSVKRALGDSTRRAPGDSARRAKADSIVLSPPDSIMRALLARKGYTATRYEGDSVAFNTRDNSILLYGKPGRIEQGLRRIAGDSIAYDATNKRVVVVGRPGRVHDPANAEDVIAFEPIQYYFEEGRGTACQIKTSASTGSIWYLTAECGAYIAADSAHRGERGAFLGRNVTLTTDSSENPQYHFKIGELKKFSENTIVGSPAKLYIGEVPVLWLPWFWTPTKRGRHSGLLPPRVTFSELTRANPGYRRHVENIGFYTAFSEYADAQIALDWRSGARPIDQDPGFVRLNAGFNYAIRDRFMQGHVTASQMSQTDGSKTLTLSLGHQQKFSSRTSFDANLNYSTNTTVLQQTTINPFAQASLIKSQVNYQTHVGPFATTIGGSQTQYPSREQIDREFPSLNITTKPIEIASWLSWTPSFNTQVSQSLHLDSPSEFGFRKFLTAAGTLDSARNDRSFRNSSMALQSPFKIKGFAVNASARFSDKLNDFPEAKLVIDPVDTSLKRTIVYGRTFISQFDWDVSVNLPSLLQGTLNFVPTVALKNVDPGSFTVRTERTGTEYVSQSKRLAVGAGISPTLFHVSNKHIGPFAAFRHSITPGLSYSYSPEADVSDKYLAALGRVRPGYLGALAQNRVSFSFSQVLEAKYKPKSDSEPPGTEKKIRLLSMQISALEYDFELAKATGRTGLASEHANISLRSDLIPGFDLSLDYSLFDAPVISDTARFSIYQEGIRAGLTLGKGASGLGPLARLWAWATGERPRGKEDTTAVGIANRANPPQTQGTGGLGAIPGLGGMNNAAQRSRATLTDLQPNQPWSATLGFSAHRPRPPHGSNVVSLDPRATCEPFRNTDPVQFNTCLRQQPPISTDYTNTQTTGGGIVYQLPPTVGFTSNIQFALTQNWTTSWQMNYDIQRHELTSQIVQLQRDLRDWRASFGFTQGVNGNFGFHFLITLKPVPDLQLPYDQQSLRSTPSR